MDERDQAHAEKCGCELVNCEFIRGWEEAIRRNSRVQKGNGVMDQRSDLRILIQDVLDDWAGLSFLGTGDINSISGVLEHEIKARYIARVWDEGWRAHVLYEPGEYGRDPNPYRNNPN